MRPMADLRTTLREQAGERRRFVRVQAAKGLVGALLAVAFTAIVVRPDATEFIAIALLTAPGILALLGLLRAPLPALETASHASFAAMVGYLVLITGGGSSPLTIWFALVPAEAALAGGRRPVMRAAAASLLALLAVGTFESFHMLPASRLIVPAWQFYLGSALAAVMQAAFVASAA